MKCENMNCRKGSKGNDVEEIQTILKGLGFYQGKIDGDYGDMTVDAVKKYQRTKSLLTDGIVGPVTCKALNNSTSAGSLSIASIKDITGHKFYKETILSAAETFRKHIHNNKNYPNYLTMTDSNGKRFNIGRSAYMGIFEDVSRFAVKNGRVPNYVVADGTANNPLAIDYQNNGYNCGPTALSMAFQMVAKWVSEPTLASQAGTTRDGTGPAQLISVARTYNFNLNVINRNITAVKNSIESGAPVIAHIHTAYSGGKSCLGYSGSYGHWVLIYGVEGNYYLVADPTKGFKKCYSTVIDNARSSSYMKYYELLV